MKQGFWGAAAAVLAVAMMACGGTGQEAQTAADTPADPPEDGDMAATPEPDASGGPTVLNEASGEAVAGPDWCPDCPQVCIDYVATLESCMAKLPEAAMPAMEQTLQATKESFRRADTPEAREAISPGCEAGLDALRKNPSCQ